MGLRVRHRATVFVDDAAREGRAAREGNVERLRSSLLQRHPGTGPEDVLRLVGDDSTADGPKHLDDAIDELVQLVLEKGGEITFVDDGALADYARVALILRY